jgi:lipase chaperone LimK
MAAPNTMLKLGAGALIAGLLYATFIAPDPAREVVVVRRDADPFAFVRSMEGTTPDGDIKQSADGELVVDAELGHLFDYYLAGLGERDLAAIRSEIERELDRRLKPGPAAQAKRLLASYLDYKRALVDVEQQLAQGGDMATSARARMAATHKLRARFFSEKESTGLFGFSDAYDLDALARIDISLDPKLNDAQRAQKLALLDQKLSPAMREEREAPTRVIRTEDNVQKMRAQGASDDEVYRVRAAAFSPEGASRLAQLDREESDWKQRMAAYQAERARLQPGAEAMQQQLRGKYFSEEEQRRLGAYE